MRGKLGKYGERNVETQGIACAKGGSERRSVLLRGKK